MLQTKVTDTAPVPVLTFFIPRMRENLFSNAYLITTMSIRNYNYVLKQNTLDIVSGLILTTSQCKHTHPSAASTPSTIMMFPIRNDAHSIT